MIAALLLFALAQDIPAYHDWVNDYAGVLSSSTRQELNAFLQAYRDQTTNEIAVLIVPTTGGQEIRQYGIKVAEKWKVGKKGKDNGVIFVVAIQDRKMAVEVGYGLEGTLTDIKSAWIIHEVAEQFKRGDYNAGVRLGVHRIVDAISGKWTPPQRALPARVKQKAPKAMGLLCMLFIVVLMIGAAFGSRRRGGWGGPWIFFGGGGGGWSSGGGGGGFGGFGGGSFGGGGASGSW